ncbi:MAG: SRPBCC family protein [Actinomycetota bacterium]
MTEHVVKTGRSSAPPEAVWDVLSDYFQLHAWASAVNHCSAMTATEAGPDASRRVVVGSNVLLEDVVEWEPNEVMAYEIVGLPRVLRSVQNRWVLTPDGDGTAIELTATIEPGPRPPMKVAAKGAAQLIGRTNKSLVHDLIIRAEQEPS